MQIYTTLVTWNAGAAYELQTVNEAKWNGKILCSPFLLFKWFHLLLLVCRCIRSEFNCTACISRGWQWIECSNNEWDGMLAISASWRKTYFWADGGKRPVIRRNRAHWLQSSHRRTIAVWHSQSFNFMDKFPFAYRDNERTIKDLFFLLCRSAYWHHVLCSVSVLSVNDNEKWSLNRHNCIWVRGRLNRHRESVEQTIYACLQLQLIRIRNWAIKWKKIMHILFVHIYYYNEFSSEPGVSHARLRSNFFIKKKINNQSSTRKDCDFCCEEARNHIYALWSIKWICRATNSHYSLLSPHFLSSYRNYYFRLIQRNERIRCV